jgi:hypothetical protein
LAVWRSGRLEKSIRRTGIVIEAVMKSSAVRLFTMLYQNTIVACIVHLLTTEQHPPGLSSAIVALMVQYVGDSTSNNFACANGNECASMQVDFTNCSLRPRPNATRGPHSDAGARSKTRWTFLSRETWSDLVLFVNKSALWQG